MAKSNKVLSIDITNESITIIEISASQKKQTNIHRVLMFETPEDSYEDGIIRDQGRIAGEIRSQLSQAGITNKNAIFVMNSTKIVNREVEIPQVKENKIAGIINANASEYFPVNVEDYVVAHSLLETITDAEGNKKMRVMAVAAPSNMVRSYYDLGAAAGLKVEALDYIGNSMLQLIKTQTTEQATTMVIQLGSESTVLNIVQGDKLLLQRTVPYGTNPVVNVVMEEKGVDATTAMAQSTTSSIAGHVSDANGPVQDAMVTAVYTPTGLVYHAFSNRDGAFRINGVVAGGPYTIKVEMMGHQTLVIKDIKAPLASTVVIEPVLKIVANTLEEVVVSAEAANSYMDMYGRCERDGSLQSVTVLLGNLDSEISPETMDLTIRTAISAVTDTLAAEGAEDIKVTAAGTVFLGKEARTVEISCRKDGQVLLEREIFLTSESYLIEIVFTGATPEEIGLLQKCCSVVR